MRRMRSGSAGRAANTASPSRLVPYLIGGLEAADRFPCLLARLFGVPDLRSFVANILETGERTRTARIEPNDVPAILRLYDVPLSFRHRQQRIAETFAEGCGEAGDRTREDGARLLLQFLGFVLLL